MDEPDLLTKFFARHRGRPRADFLRDFDGGFLLGRFKGEKPRILALRREPDRTIKLGADEGCDFPFEEDQTLDEVHALVTYHPFFRGWKIEDNMTSFGTLIDGQRLNNSRTFILQDRQVVKLGGGLSEVQFYLAETLFNRMDQSGVTRRQRRPKAPQPVVPPPLIDDDDTPAPGGAVDVSDSSWED